MDNRHFSFMGGDGCSAQDRCAHQSRGNPIHAAILVSVSLGIFLLLVSAGAARGQTGVFTYHVDNNRTGQYTNETFLSPSTVNFNSFGKLFSLAVDGFVVAQPLYVPNVNIPGLGIHNVVYVVTQHDSVYAFDADSPRSAPLWQTSFINPASGITTEPIADNGCASIGFTEIGIMGTPVIDPTTGTLYVSAKTKEVTGAAHSYVHRLHALDITTGTEKFGGPVVINASITGTGGVINFDSLRQNQRPALLLSNGTLYLAFGSTGCDLGAHGWVFAYNPATLQQQAVFNTSPNQPAGEASIWQSGSGLAADVNGNVYFATANGSFDANLGDPDYGDSFLKLSLGSGGLTVTDYFTPYDQANMKTLDLDLGSGGVLLLPDQAGGNPHLMIGAGKTGTVYLVNRDNMGRYNAVDNSQIIQSLPNAIGPFYSTPEYWNGHVYFFANSDTVKSFTLTNGLLSSAPAAQSKNFPVGGVPSISANGNSNGILWTVRNPSAPVLSALNALTLTEVYNSGQAGTRDTLSAPAHFITPTIASGKVYVGTQTQLLVYGLLSKLTAVSGSKQTAAAGSALPIALSIKATDPYSGSPIGGVTVTFSASAAGGNFSNPTAVTDDTGTASTFYTLPGKAGAITITASATKSVAATLTETATPGTPASIGVMAGGGQNGTAGATLSSPLIVAVKDAYGNLVPGTSVTFSDGGAGGVLSATPVTTNSLGQASVTYTLPTQAQTVTVTASVASLVARLSEKATAGTPTTVAAIAGNNQSGHPSTMLAAVLVVVVKDAFGNAVSGVTVMFSDAGAGGIFSSPAAVTTATGKASTSYTTPPQVGSVTINASIAGLGPAVFKENVQ